MSKTISVTEAERDALFRVIRDWNNSYSEYYESEYAEGMISDEVYQDEWVANTRVVSKILTKLDIVDNVFHEHVGQDHVVCESCENKKEGEQK